MALVKLLVDVRYPAAWVNFQPYKAGQVLPVIPATNIPEPGCYWIDTPELKDDCYGILLEPGDFEMVEESENA